MTLAKMPDDFDAETYLRLNEDIAKAGLDPVEHYLNWGFFEARRYREDHDGRTAVRQSWREKLRSFLSETFLGHENRSSFDAFLLSKEPSFKHSTYFPVYDQLLSQYRGKPITFIEVGVLNGGSLFMWRKFFGKKARIIGVDLNPDAKKWEAHGFEIFIGNQADPNFWETLFAQTGDVDVLLDDGGHTYVQQIVTAECSMAHIRDGGMVIIEDTHTSYMDGFGERKKSLYDYVNGLIVKMNMRFGAFQDKPNERRIWSVELFESIVALKANHMAAKELSQPIWNRSPDKLAKDFRDVEVEESPETVSKRDAILKRVFDPS